MPVKFSNNVCIFCLKRFGEDGRGIKEKKKEFSTLMDAYKSVRSHDNLLTTILNGVVTLNDHSVPQEDPLKLDSDTEEHEPMHKEPEIDEAPSTDPELYRRFFQFVCRHLRLSESGKKFLRQAQEYEKKKGECVQAFCEECSYLISEICDLYNELATVKLRLTFKLGLLGEILSRSTKKVSIKMVRTLMRAVSEQVNSPSVRQVDIFRRTLKKKCINDGRDRGEDFPRILVSRGLFPEEWKFSCKDTQKALMSLIAVFVLANPSLHLKVERVEIIASQGETQQGNVDKHIDGDDQNGGSSEKSGTDTDSNGEPSTSLDPVMEDSQMKGMEAPQDNPIQRWKWNLRRRNTTKKWRFGKGDNDKTDDTEEADENWVPSSRISRHGREATRSRSRISIDRQVPCSKCTRKFIDLRGLSVHLKTVHLSHIDYPCKLCTMKFKRRQDLRAHRQRAHRQRFIQSTRLADNPKTSRGRSRFCKTNGSKNSQECPICFRPLCVQDNLWKHMLRHETDLKVMNKQNHTCEVCGQSFSTPDAVAAHMQESHGGTYQCLLCSDNNEFPSSKDLQEHLQTHEKPGDEQPYQCHSCHLKFTIKQNFDLHQVTHGINKSFYCDDVQCSEVFLSVQDLNEHLKEHASKPEDAEPATSVLPVDGETQTCEVEAENKSEEKRAEVSTLLECGKCGSKFLHRNTLFLHELIHTPPNKDLGGYNCPKCSRNIRHMENLLVHFDAKHRDLLEEEPFNCEPCKRTFTTSKWYKIHLKMHLVVGEVVTFSCEDCGAAFIDAYSLSLHKRSHNQSKNDRKEKLVRVSFDPNLNPASPPTQDKKEACKTRRNLQSSQTLKATIWKKTLEKWCKTECEVCKESLESPYHLRKHLESMHETEQEKPFQCCFCCEAFTLEQTHDLHMRAAHEKKLFCGFDCDDLDCKKKLPTFADLHEHLKTHQQTMSKKLEDENQEEGPSTDNLPPETSLFECSKCKWPFLSQDWLELHEVMHIRPVDGMYRCPRNGCSFEIAKLLRVVSHVNRIHGKNIQPHACTFCDKRFFSKLALSHHCQDKHRKTEQKESTMDEILKNQERKKVPRKKRSGATLTATIPCPQCPKTFKQRYQLNFHMRTKHPVNGTVEKLPCPECGKEVAKHFMTSHMKRHKEPTLECDVCKKKFREESTLKFHKNRVHIPEEEKTKDFMCAECGLAYRTQTGLSMHVGCVHMPDSEKGFECARCSKRFHVKTLLTKHEKACLQNQKKEVEMGAMNTKNLTKKKRGKLQAQESLRRIRKRRIQKVTAKKAHNGAKQKKTKRGIPATAKKCWGRPRGSKRKLDKVDKNSDGDQVIEEDQNDAHKPLKASQGELRRGKMRKSADLPEITNHEDLTKKNRNMKPTKGLRGSKKIETTPKKRGRKPKAKEDDLPTPNESNLLTRNGSSDAAENSSKENDSFGSKTPITESAIKAILTNLTGISNIEEFSNSSDEAEQPTRRLSSRLASKQRKCSSSATPSSKSMNSGKIRKKSGRAHGDNPPSSHPPPILQPQQSTSALQSVMQHMLQHCTTTPIVDQHRSIMPPVLTACDNKYDDLASQYEQWLSSTSAGFMGEQVEVVEPGSRDTQTTQPQK